MKLYRFEKFDQCYKNDHCKKINKNEQRLQTIKDKSIWLSPPRSFNDLDDSLLQSVYMTADKNTYKVLKETFETIQKLTNNYLFPFPQEIEDAIISLLSLYPQKSVPKLRDINFTENQREKLITDVGNYIRASTGVCCFFKDKPSTPLMWAHYADSHKGFCVEYEVNQDIQNLFEVNYTTKPESPSIEELLLCPRHAIRKLITRKSYEWSYEKEYRLIYINEFNPGDNGKNKPLPDGIRACKLIKGARIENSMEIDELAETLNIPVLSYEKFTNS